ncbi:MULTISPECIES: hypothetical protein [unclassified Erwinia]|uniref:hypothetical protein n=1 Tax=unclassified Erwinia TaxID=2622719 RepID=UPI00190972AD|nr:MULTISPECIES: hypothetical protein [unclassified Erwinia]MBK0001951.1 hypothetical protein [Erwinia sp. S38]MCW1875770.1 hypothetical protein [Erwinia sp. INIA01]
MLHLQHKCCLDAANAAAGVQRKDIAGNDQDLAGLWCLCCENGIKSDDYLAVFLLRIDLLGLTPGEIILIRISPR